MLTVTIQMDITVRALIVRALIGAGLINKVFTETVLESMEKDTMPSASISRDLTGMAMIPMEKTVGA